MRSGLYFGVFLLLAPASAVTAQAPTNAILAPPPATPQTAVGANIQMTGTLPSGEAATVLLERSINVGTDQLGGGAGTDHVNGGKMQTPRGLFTLSSINYKPDTFSFDCAGCGGRFTGSYSSDAQGYVGIWYHNGKSSPLTLRENVARVDVTFP